MAGFRISEQTPFNIEMRFTMNKLLSCRFNMDTNRVEAQFADGSTVAIDCIAIEDEYGNTPAQRAELDWLLYNKPLEYAQMVLSGEIEHYLSLGCDHGYSGKQPLDHQTPCTLIYIGRIIYRTGQSNQSTGQFVLKLRYIGGLSADACFSHAAGAACCLLTLKTKHFSIHLEILTFFNQVYFRP